MTLSKLTPNLMADDVARTIRFYKSILNFEVLMSLPVESDEPFWALLKSGNVEIMLQSKKAIIDEYPCMNNTSPGGTLTLYINTDNAKALFGRIDKKVKIVKPLHRTCYGTEEFSIMDCNNYILTFSQDMTLIRF